MDYWSRIGLVCRMAVALIAISASPVAAAEQENAIVKEEFLVQGKDQGVKLFVREKRLANLPKIVKENVILFIHGVPGPGSVMFDLAIPGYSWLEYVAERGFDAFTLDIRGFGRSTRPPEMKESPHQNLPVVRADQVMRDIDVAVDYIRSKRKVDKINIVGYSIGASWSALYATLHPEKVGKLVMYGAIYGKNSTFISAFGDPTNTDRPYLEMGAYRYLGQKELLDQWDGWIKPSSRMNGETERSLMRGSAHCWAPILQPNNAVRNRFRSPTARTSIGTKSTRADRCSIRRRSRRQR